MKKIFFSISIFIILFLLFGKVFAAESSDFKSDYTVEYFLTKKDGHIESNASLAIKITNLKSDVYVRKYQLSFPKSFEISNIEAKDDTGPIRPNIIADSVNSKIELEFMNPNIGRGSTNTFYLKYKQNNLFKVNGNIWEVIIPTIENSPSYRIIVNLPPDTEKKISLAKPKPDEIVGTQIIWNNPKTKTVYATFGDSQFYELLLDYQIGNPKIVPVYTDIALPPDTLYQKVYLKNIVPQPAKVFADHDGNYMARYVLLPGETKKIKYSSTVETHVKPDEEIIKKVRYDIVSQKEYLLLKSAGVWDSRGIMGISTFDTPQKVFDFVTNSLSYDYSRIDDVPKRLGAAAALSSPNTALCQEYSDVFVSVSRANKILTRELEGFAFTEDEVFRPLSLRRDLLHSWVEYFDTKAKLWLSVDPTWADTSGIDYFNSLDFNHIVFAIHGHEASMPAPAGSYKTKDENQVRVSITRDKPDRVIHFSMEKISFSPKVNDRNTYELIVKVKNDGNVGVYDVPILLSSDGLIFSPSGTVSIDSLIPLEEKEYKFTYQSNRKSNLYKTQLSILIGGKEYYHDTVSVYPYYFDLGLKVSVLICIMMAIFSIILVVKRHRWKT